MLHLPRVIGHRGAPAVEPENTLAGFAAARAAGAGWIECDVRLTRDLIPVILHDSTLERTTSGRGRLADLSWAELADLRTAKGEPIPSLAATLLRLRELGLGVNLELKSDPGRETETAIRVAASVRAGWIGGRGDLVLTSFAEPCLAALAEAAPDMPRGYLVERLPPDWDARAGRLGCIAVSLGEIAADQAALTAIKASGRQSMLWTVNDPHRAAELLRWGADAHISDDPGRLLADPRVKGH